jgi:hypothetical protein
MRVVAAQPSATSATESVVIVASCRPICAAPGTSDLSVRTRRSHTNPRYQYAGCGASCASILQLRGDILCDLCRRRFAAKPRVAEYRDPDFTDVLCVLAELRGAT